MTGGPLSTGFEGTGARISIGVGTGIGAGGLIAATVVAGGVVCTCGVTTAFGVGCFAAGVPTLVSHGTGLGACVLTAAWCRAGGVTDGLGCA